MATRDQSGDGWTVVLRRQLARLVQGRAEGGYTDMFEIICCDCGDDPGLGNSQVSPELRRVSGPYPVADGISAHVTHVRLHRQPARAASRGRGRMLADRR
jgi:hypothetical protein